MDYRKQYESLQFKDDFMFGVVMSDMSIAKRVLSVILAEEIPDIENCELQRTVQNDTISHGVRYDVYIRTSDGTKVYDIEMQTVNNDFLPKRSRYYQSASDMDFLSRGQMYKALPATYIIFICEFDLFEKGNAVYRFENYCIEENLRLDDQAYKIFLNTAGQTPRKELQNLMTYLKDNLPNDELTQDIQNKIQDAQHDGKLYSAYVKEQQNAMLLLERARAEGEAKGRAEGEAKGIAKAIIMLKNVGATMEMMVNNLVTEYSMNREDAAAKVKEVLAQAT